MVTRIIAALLVLSACGGEEQAPLNVDPSGMPERPPVKAQPTLEDMWHQIDPTYEPPVQVIVKADCSVLLTDGSTTSYTMGRCVLESKATDEGARRLGLAQGALLCQYKPCAAEPKCLGWVTAEICHDGE